MLTALIYAIQGAKAGITSTPSSLPLVVSQNSALEEILSEEGLLGHHHHHHHWPRHEAWHPTEQTGANPQLFL